MRKVIAGAFVSLDGVMQAPGGPEEDPTGGFSLGGWTVNYWDASMEQFMGTQFSRPFDLLLGRKTYEIFAAYWPDKQDPIAEAFNKATKYVASRSGAPLTWDKSALLRDAAADVAKLRGEDGPELLIQGSSNLIQTLLKAQLIDEFRLLTFPLVLGKGKRLFEDGAPSFGLALADTRTSGTGVVMSTYQPAGPVIPGSFALDEPTEAEEARRERMKREG